MTTFETILNQLFQTAMQDGKISKDEFEIINQVKIDLELFEKALQQAEEDAFLDPKEIAKLIDLKERILQRAKLVASIDETVTDEEIKLLQTLSKAVQNLI